MLEVAGGLLTTKRNLGRVFKVAVFNTIFILRESFYFKFFPTKNFWNGVGQDRFYPWVS